MLRSKAVSMAYATLAINRQLRATARFRRTMVLVNERLPSDDRLDSWKAIAEYLQRDLATVRRWEKGLGLPIHRVGGTGRSVFAYTSEIDEWLTRAKPLIPILDPILPALDPLLSPAPPARSTFPWRWAVALVAVLGLVASLYVRGRWTEVGDLQVEVTSAGVIARDSAGVERWRHLFPVTLKTAVVGEPVVATRGPQPGVYFASSYSARQTNDQVESGTLTFLDLNGTPRQSFSFDDDVTFHGTSYGAPWLLSAFAVSEEGGTRRVAVAAHHYVWDPSVVTVLDERWQRRGTFVHAGWIEGVRWLGPDRLLIAGFSNAHDGATIALLDAAALDGQGPEPAGGPHFCESCGAGRPLRMFIFPRTELNRITTSRFNRALILTSAGGPIFVHTIEMMSEPPHQGDADAVYEFTNPSLDFVSARFSERYWEMHRALEADGTIGHTRDQCPDRDGPKGIQMWEPATGWRSVQTR